MWLLVFLLSLCLFTFLFLWFDDFRGNIQEEFSMDVKCRVFGKNEWEKYPEFQERKETPTYKQKVPFLIFQTNEEKVLPGMKGALDSWVQKNSEYKHMYFPTEKQREFLVEHFDQKVVKAYDSLVPGAYKADLFRYCVMWVNGGVYADSAMVCLSPLRDWLPRDKSLVSAKDEGVSSGIYQAFFAVTPNHPALKRIIDLVVSRVENKEYGERDLYTTGPIAFGNGLNLWLGRKENEQFQPGDLGEQVFLFHRYSRPGKKIEGIFNKEGKELVRTKYDCSFHEKSLWSKLPSYSVLWKEKKIFV
ncbi:mannosyltransferase OCH1 and related enzymes [Tokyovirus A1]|uniref:mannosyltransferase OCH1 and related enzymes n=1 Tax=Tokyovirus A1 TaxID=1826170 RepID=UPI0007A96C60|nr:mannosyltransferase OCH1 and related enzymes [Tokyovirus A1]BAU80075.1 mannosyltransferase OCH1 and related enzymes [Tokyovirus A1]